MSTKSKLELNYDANKSVRATKFQKDQQLLNKSWIAKVITLYPEMFPGTLGCSILGNALRENIWSLEVLNLRDYGVGKHNEVDNTPSGGGPGMVLRPDVIDDAVVAATQNINPADTDWSIINLTPRGDPLTQKISLEIAKMKGAILLCGRFEGVDQRVIDKWRMREISIGDFIITGGEIAAQALIDSVVRNLPGVLGNNLSTVDESFSDGLLEYPQYTKPSVWNGKKVPAVLLSGNHNKVRDWKRKKSRELTKNRRPDLLSKLKKNP